ncbi:MAG TPA: nucleoside hydrolase [Terriglobales bacterium]|nr:nucleoside hydrolase [Terriglobales bacterium]
MKSRLAAVMVAAFLLAVSGSLRAQKIKIILDQDARGPATTDLQSLLIFLQSDKFDVLGITTVSGDQWVKEETQHTLRLLEIAERTDVPVAEGAEFPLLNSKEETERWEALYGKFRYKGCWNDFPRQPPGAAGAFFPPYHDPEVVPPLPEGSPHIKPLDETAAHFIVRMVHQYPGQVVVWAGGPLTNIALALRLDPQVASLAKELVLMGSGMYADTGGIGTIDGRREFNWWFDPEAVRIVMRAPWKKITITPIDVSIKTRVTPEITGAIAKANTPVASYLAKYSVPSFMWDELSAAALIDPSIITGQKQLYVDIDINHGPSYGETLFWAAGSEVPPYERLATVQFDVNAQKLYDLYIKLMTQPARQGK